MNDSLKDLAMAALICRQRADRIKQMKKKIKYKLLRPKNKIKLGDYLTLGDNFNKFNLGKIDKICASHAWVKLKNKCGVWIGKRVSEYGGYCARKIQ